MANHASAKKRARQDLKRRDRNRAVKSEVRKTARAVRSAIAGGDRDAAQSSLRAAERSLRKATSKGVLKKTTASRQISRLARAVHQIG